MSSLSDHVQNSPTAGIGFLILVIGAYGLYLHVNGKLTGTLAKLFDYTSKSSSSSTGTTSTSTVTDPNGQSVQPLSPTSSGLKILPNMFK